MSEILRRRTVALFATSAMVMFVAACGGSDDGSSDSGGSAPGGGNNPMTAYVECLQQNGVTLAMPSGGPRERPSGAPPSGVPRPSGSAGLGQGFPGGGGFGKPAGVDDETWNKAQSACAPVRPSMGARPGGSNGPGGGADAAYRNCLQDNGANPADGLNTTDPTVAKAMETCKVLRPDTAASPTG